MNRPVSSLWRHKWCHNVWRHTWRHVTFAVTLYCDVTHVSQMTQSDVTMPYDTAISVRWCGRTRQKLKLKDNTVMLQGETGHNVRQCPVHSDFFFVFYLISFNVKRVSTSVATFCNSPIFGTTRPIFKHQKVSNNWKIHDRTIIDQRVTNGVGERLGQRHPLGPFQGGSGGCGMSIEWTIAIL